MKQIKIFDSKVRALESLKENIPFTVSINNLKICIVRTKSNLIAFDHKCPHSGASLSEGFVNMENEIVCPLHGYRFSLTDGRETSGNKCELKLYGLVLDENGLYLQLR